MNELDNLMTHALTLDIDHSDITRFTIHGASFVHKERISSIPGSRFIGKGKDYWAVPRTWVSAQLLVRMFGDKLVWTADAEAFVNSLWSDTIEPALGLRNEGAKPEWITAVADMAPANRRPRDYQVSGALFLATAKRAMLLDEQGTGKMTQTALALSLYPDTLPALIVAPKGTIYTWQNELALFGLKSVVIDGSDSAVKRRSSFDNFDPSVTPVMITTYSMLSKHSRVSGYGAIKLSEADRQHKELNQISWSTVVADEAHRAKEASATQTRALWAVSENAPYRWATTGTPTESNIIDFWALLHFIDPIEWPSSTKFRDLWVLQYANHFGGMEVIGLRPDTMDEFHALTDWHWRRVLKGDDLPPREYLDVFHTASAKETKTYRDLHKQLMADIGGNGSIDVLFAENHMVKAGRCMQAASATLEFDSEDNVRMVEPSSKLDALADTLEDHAGVATILWFKNRDLLHMQEARFNKSGVPFVSIHGDVTGKDRADAVTSFQDGKVNYILITIGAGSEGTTLTRAPLAIFVQREWSLIKQQQAPDRNHRIGSEMHDRILYINLISRGTIEEDLGAHLAEKEGMKQELVRD